MCVGYSTKKKKLIETMSKCIQIFYTLHSTANWKKEEEENLV